MAEIADFHRQQPPEPQQTLRPRAVTAVVFEEDPSADLCLLDFESISPPFPSYLNASTPFFGQSDNGSNGSVFFGDEAEDDADDMSFISELVSTRRVQLDVPDYRDSIFVEAGSQSDLECIDGGLRVTDMGSEALEVVSGAEIVNNRDEFHECDMEFGGIWDCLEFNGNRGADESEWEEVNERVHVSSVIDRVEEIALSPEGGENMWIINGGEEVPDDTITRNHEWQFLLAADLEFFPIDSDEPLLDFVDFIEIENSTRGSPPASKQVIENLPLVVLSPEYSIANSVVCAVCKDEITLVDEKVTKLPCSHYYHMLCIVPWLRMRNTCPVCRYEFPTDDSDYERSKNGGGGVPYSTRNFNLSNID